MKIRLPKGLQVRYENFGGIVASEEPAFLAYVDRQFMREMGLTSSPLWEVSENIGAPLSAPLEVHLAVTNACTETCRHCYMDSGQKERGEMSTQELKQCLKELSDMGVFHVALGGGEALMRSDLFEIAEYAREVGIVPNLTTSGSLIHEKMIEKMKVFGLVNVSLDGIEKEYGHWRVKKGFEQADRALKALRQSGIASGINCVVGRSNFSKLENLFEYASDIDAVEIEILRFKPAGRGKESYHQEKTTYEQNKALIPKVTELSHRFGITVKIDCSFVPMLAYHNPDRELLDQVSVHGCEAGHAILGIRSNGEIHGCSFLRDSDAHVRKGVQKAWSENKNLNEHRNLHLELPEPCNSCSFKALCKGGCRAVSLEVTGKSWSPDPDCPKVVEYHA